MAKKMQQQDNIEAGESNAPFIKQSVDVSQQVGSDVSQNAGGTASTPNPDWATGIDVSQYQQTIDWKRVSEAGHAFAFIKATESDDKVDAMFSANWTGAKGAGVLRGAYHFFQADVDPITQADHFIKTVLSMNDEGELPPALDFEPGDPKKTGAPAERIKAWLDRVEAGLGKKPIVYSNRQILEELISADGSTPPWTNDYPLWIAYYPSKGKPDVFPLLPRSWRNWTLWQYADKGSVDGIQGNVDLNYFNGSKADLEAFARVPSRKQRLNFALNDRPEGPDRLNYETYADAFAQLLSGRYTQTPLTVGIYASWGMGKSFLLGKIREKLEAVKSADNPLDFAFIPFNAWVYSGSENLWAGLITTLYDGIEKHYESKGGRLVQGYRRNQSLKQLGRTFMKSFFLTLLFGIPAAVYSYFFYQKEIQESWAGVVQTVLLILGGAPILSKLPDLVKGLKSLVDSVVLLRSKELAELSSRKDFKDKVGFMADIQQELRHISDLIRELDKKQGKTTRFIIFVDDLDRCPPNKAVEALEAIMLLLSDRDRDPFVIFLAMDARVLVKAVEKRYGEVLTEAGISGYEFLDKIVQIPFRIPYAGNDEIRSYVNSLLYQTPEAQEKAEESERKIEVKPQGEVQGLTPATGEGTQTPGGGGAAGPATRPEVRGEAAKAVVSTPPEEEAFRDDESKAFKSLSPFMSRNPRRVKRIVNIYRLARILLRRSVPPEVAIKWVMLTEQWPFRVAWVLQKLEDEVQMERDVPGDTPLARLYEDVRGNVEDRRSRKLAALDEDAELFESFIKQAPLITTEHISLLWDVTFNLNPAMQNEVLKNAVKNGRRLEVRSSR